MLSLLNTGGVVRDRAISARERVSWRIVEAICATAALLRATVDELISLDRGYLANWSPWTDILIVAGTARSLMRRAGG